MLTRTLATLTLLLALSGRADRPIPRPAQADHARAAGPAWTVDDTEGCREAPAAPAPVAAAACSDQEQP